MDTNYKKLLKKAYTKLLLSNSAWLVLTPFSSADIVEFDLNNIDLNNIESSFKQISNQKKYTSLYQFVNDLCRHFADKSNKLIQIIEMYSDLVDFNNILKDLLKKNNYCNVELIINSGAITQENLDVNLIEFSKLPHNQFVYFYNKYLSCCDFNSVFFEIFRTNNLKNIDNIKYLIECGYNAHIYDKRILRYVFSIIQNKNYFEWLINHGSPLDFITNKYFCLAIFKYKSVQNPNIFDEFIDLLNFLPTYIDCKNNLFIFSIVNSKSVRLITYFLRYIDFNIVSELIFPKKNTIIIEYFKNLKMYYIDIVRIYIYSPLANKHYGLRKTYLNNIKRLSLIDRHLRSMLSINLDKLIDSSNTNDCLHIDCVLESIIIKLVELDNLKQAISYIDRLSVHKLNNVVLYFVECDLIDKVQYFTDNCIVFNVYAALMVCKTKNMFDFLMCNYCKEIDQKLLLSYTIVNRHNTCFRFLVQSNINLLEIYPDILLDCLFYSIEMFTVLIEYVDCLNFITTDDLIDFFKIINYDIHYEYVCLYTLLIVTKYIFAKCNIDFSNKKLKTEIIFTHFKNLIDLSLEYGCTFNDIELQELNDVELHKLTSNHDTCVLDTRDFRLTNLVHLLLNYGVKTDIILQLVLTLTNFELLSIKN